MVAHTCPKCGQTCHCNGDIDDIILDCEEDILACDHCDEYDDNLWDTPDEWEDYEHDDAAPIGGCTCAKPTDEYHGWECIIQGGPCMYLMPNSKACARDYGEGPDAYHPKCEDCADFSLEDGKRCCKTHPYYPVAPGEEKPKYLEDNTASCGGFKATEEKQNEEGGVAGGQTD